MPKTIVIDRERLVEGEPCFEVDGEFWPGFSARRCVIFVKAEGGRSWMEYHGDDDDIVPGGNVFVSSGETELFGFNLFPVEQMERLRANPALYFGAINKHNVRREVTACTIYNAQCALLVPSFRFDKVVTSTVISPPIPGPPEPLNAWIEVEVGADGRWEHFA